MQWHYNPQYFHKTRNGKTKRQFFSLSFSCLKGLEYKSFFALKLLLEWSCIPYDFGVQLLLTFKLTSKARETWGHIFEIEGGNINDLKGKGRSIQKGYKEKCNPKGKGGMVGDQFSCCVYTKRCWWEGTRWLWRCTCLSPSCAGAVAPQAPRGTIPSAVRIWGLILNSWWVHSVQRLKETAPLYK